MGVGFAVEPKEWWREQGNDAPDRRNAEQNVKDRDGPLEVQDQCTVLFGCVEEGPQDGLER